MQIRKRIKVEVEESIFYFKPLTMEEAMLRKELADKLDTGGNISEMGDSIADLLIGWENVKGEEDKDIVFDVATYKKIFLGEFSVFQVLAIIKAFLKEIGWTSDEEDALPNVSDGSSA
jgi:hypothetical protein